MSKDITIPEVDTLFPAIDDYSGIVLSENAKNKLARTLMSTKVGMVTLAPLICPGGNKCPFAERCPISKGESFPVHKQCIVELNLARQKFVDYVEEFDVEDDIQNSPTLRALISKLADFDVYEYRIKLILAGAGGKKVKSDGTLLLEQVVSIEEKTEEPIEQLQEHPAWRILERINKQRLEILTALEATPKEKTRKKAINKEVSQSDVLSQQTKILEQMDALAKAIKKDQ